MKRILIFLLLTYIGLNSSSAQGLADYLPIPSASQREWIQQFGPANNQMQRDRKVIYRRILISEHDNKPLFYPASYKNSSVRFTELVVGSILLNRIPTFTYQPPPFDLSTLKEIKADSIHLLKDLYWHSFDSISPSMANINDFDWSKIGAYLIKEVHYLSANDSQLQFYIEAICPLYTTYTGGEEGFYPLAWVKYKDVEPFLMLLNTSIYNKNDNDIYSLNDYFRMHLYEGDIIRLGERFDRTSYTVVEDNQKGSLYNDSILKLDIDKMEHRYFTPQDSLPTKKKKTIYNSPHRSVKR